MPNRIKLTLKKREEFIGLLSETCNVTESAKAIGMSRRYMYEVRDSECIDKSQYKMAQPN